MAGDAAREEEPRARSTPEPARPFLKWAGGKAQLLAQFAPLLPRSHRGYFEPFVGGAALFFSRQAMLRGRVVLSDVNPELVNCYRAVRDRVDDVIAALEGHVYAPDYYYRVRAMDPLGMDPAARAARTIFLNKAGYNGLYRVNRAGRFNVPFGRHRNPLLCDEANLRACSVALGRVCIEEHDFQQVLSSARRGDFVYFDPPYVPVSETAVFTSYVPGGFDWAQQRRLADAFAELSDRGVLAMLSNSDTPRVRRLYRGFQIDRVSAPRSINSNATKRGKVGEVVVRNYALKQPAARR